MTQQKENRFINSNLPKLQEANHNSIFDYENLPLLTLEKTVEKIVPFVSHVMDYVTIAKEKYNQHSILLTPDESAAIYLYTMPKEFFSKLNIALRDANRQVLKPWLHFLKLLITALKKLPPTKTKFTIWRAVNNDVVFTLDDGKVYTWWDITSCSKNINIVQPFLGENGTLFAIETIYGRDISMFSAVPEEEEVIILPGTRVHARQSLNFIDRLFIIHLEEIIPQR
jgi:hypothetical protein